MVNPDAMIHIMNTARDREIVHVIEYSCDLYGHFRINARDREIVVLYIDTIT